MHELSLASAIAEKVLAHAQSRPGARVREVRLAVGEWMCVQVEQLTFCYRAIIQETPIEESTLAIERVEGSVHCPHCGYDGRPAYWDDAQWLAPVATLQCPRCQQTAQIVAGQDCAIRSIQYAR